MTKQLQLCQLDHQTSMKSGRCLKERGFDPDQWEIQSLTVNQWEAPDVDGGKRLMEQTKATLKQKPQFLGELISAIGNLAKDGFSPQPTFKAKKQTRAPRCSG